MRKIKIEELNFFLRKGTPLYNSPMIAPKAKISIGLE